MALQRWLSNAERIDSAVNDFEGLFRGRIRERPLTSTTQGPGQRITRRRERPAIALQQIPFPFNFLAQVIYLGRVAYFQDHLVIAATCLSAYIFDVESSFLSNQLRSRR